ncbi:MAG: hypothetical protein KAQ98_01810 [Bacteriovoracaceae bacterium]|nr:hypothetical protein [Bacteriovoracaceae bacterium]
MVNSLRKQKTRYRLLKRKYLSHTKKSRQFINTARSISRKEISDNIHDLINGPAPHKLLVLLKDIVGSGTWISSAYIKHIVTMIKFLDNEESIPLAKRKSIVESIAKNEKIDTQQITQLEIFHAIYQEIQEVYKNPEYKTPLKCKAPKTTVVLVSGVLNEIFKTAAFEHGTRILGKELGFKYFVADVHGTKGVKYNARRIELQFKDYIKKHPEEKLWIIAYSKGGIDTLHFLKKNKKFANEHIIGFSTIATPILGSNHPDNKLLKILKNFQKLAKNHIFTKDKAKRDLFANKLQESLSTKVQKQWFQRNYKHLPDKIFYTSLGLNASWHESHIGMIITKIFFSSDRLNDGVVDTIQTQYPPYFPAYNLGIIKGHHLIGYRSSSFSQEALIKAHIIFLNYIKKL